MASIHVALHVVFGDLTTVHVLSLHVCYGSNGYWKNITGDTPVVDDTKGWTQLPLILKEFGG